MNWTNYLFWRDFSAHADMLSELPLGVVDDDAALILGSILQEIDEGEGKALWNVDPESREFSLCGAEVLYNGENNHSFATLSTYKNVLVLRFPEASVKPVDRIYLCWN